MVVTYHDRARSFKRADESVDNLVVRKLRGENHTASFDLPHVTRRSQVAAFAADRVRKLGQPLATATIALRTETIGTLGTGDKLRFDRDPEPLSDQLPALAVIDDRRDDASGTTKLKLVIDPLSSHAVTAGTFSEPVVAPVTVPDLVHALVIPLPVITWTSPISNLGLTDSAGDIALALSVVDADANLVSLRVDSTRTDGTDAANHASLSFAPAGSRAWSGTVNFGPGVWFLTVTAIDLNGNATVATRILQNDAAGADLHVPNAAPGSGAVFTGPWSCPSPSRVRPIGSNSCSITPAAMPRLWAAASSPGPPPPSPSLTPIGSGSAPGTASSGPRGSSPTTSEPEIP